MAWKMRTSLSLPPFVAVSIVHVYGNRRPWALKQYANRQQACAAPRSRLAGGTTKSLEEQLLGSAGATHNVRGATSLALPATAWTRAWLLAGLIAWVNGQGFNFSVIARKLEQSCGPELRTPVCISTNLRARLSGRQKRRAPLQTP